MSDGGKNIRLALDLGSRRTLKRAPITAAEESTVCTLAETSLRLAYPDSHPKVAPAADGDGLRGVLDVRLEWPGEAPLAVRVVVHDEMARAQWREVSIAIGDAVRAALRDRCPAHPHPHTERK